MLSKTHDLDGEKATLDLATLVNHASTGVVTANLNVERRMYDLQVVHRQHHVDTPDYIYYSMCAAQALAEAAKMLADAWENYHYLQAAQSRETIIIKKA